MKGLNFTNILGALCLAGIFAMLSGIIADTFVSPQNLDKDAIPVEVTLASSDSAVAAVPKGVPEISSMLASADTTKGKKVSKACASCHSFDQGGRHGTGPNLYAIINRPIASVAGFSYSDGMAAKSTENWTYEELNKFLYKPKKHITGTKMNFVGIKKNAKRANLIAWLRTLADTPADLPSVEIAPDAPAVETE